jgi:hypothetical protein
MLVTPRKFPARAMPEAEREDSATLRGDVPSALIKTFSS